MHRTYHIVAASLGTIALIHLAVDEKSIGYALTAIAALALTIDMIVCNYKRKENGTA